jgi:hypothetical protein
MTSELDEDKDSGYLLVKRNGETIANYPIDKLKELYYDFKKICSTSTSEFKDYASLDDFINSIDFLEFLEYFLDHLNSLFPDVSPYTKNKTKLTKNELFIMNTLSFKKLIGFTYSYLYYSGNDLRLLYNNINIELNKIKNTKIFKKKEQKILIKLYNGFLYFLELLIERPNDIYPEMTLFTMFKIKLLQGKLNKSQPTFNQSSLTMIYNLFEYNEMLEYKKNLLSKFRLFQRKYLSEIAKLRKIGPPNATKEELLEIKKELNKNKSIDYKAYEIFCKYVLSKEENEDIYDYLAGIHKNSNGSVIHKNINYNTVANIKAITKKTHHKEYLERSEAILKMVEAKIEKHGNIIDKEKKNQVKIIRALFDSKQFRNMTLSFGNGSSPSIEGKIIHQCKTIRIINKEIDKMIKEHMNKEKQDKEERKQDKIKKRKQDKRNFISNLFAKHSNIQNENNFKQIIKKLLSKYTNKLKNKTLKDLERKNTLEIIQKLKAYKNSNL